MDEDKLEPGARTLEEMARERAERHNHGTALSIFTGRVMGSFGSHRKVPRWSFMIRKNPPPPGKPTRLSPAEMKVFRWLEDRPNDRMPNNFYELCTQVGYGADQVTRWLRQPHVQREFRERAKMKASYAYAHTFKSLVDSANLGGPLGAPDRKTFFTIHGDLGAAGTRLKEAVAEGAAAGAAGGVLAASAMKQYFRERDEEAKKIEEEQRLMKEKGLDAALEAGYVDFGRAPGEPGDAG